MVSEPNYRTAIFFFRKFSHRSEKKNIFSNKPVYLSNLEINEIVVKNYVKPKYGKKEARLCYIDTKSFIFYIKTEDIYDNIAKDVKTRFDASNCELECHLKEKNKKVIGSMKDESSGEIMAEFCHSSLTDNSD